MKRKMSWRSLKFIPTGGDESQAICRKDKGFMHLCEQFRYGSHPLISSRCLARESQAQFNGGQSHQPMNLASMPSPFAETLNAIQVYYF